MVEILYNFSKTEFREAFETFDRDKDGVISVDELRRIFKMIGLDLPEKDIQEMFNDADEDGKKNFKITSK